MIDVKYSVCVRCITYNQAQYVNDTLAGFCAQQTDFPFVCCIIDDASTDGEREILLNYIKHNFEIYSNSSCNTAEVAYADVVQGHHITNENCHFVLILLKENHWQKGLHYKKYSYMREWYEASKYVALCEGDDYWIDPLKLQKQVDYLDSHPDCMLVGTNGLVLWDNGVKRPSYFSDIHKSTELTPEYIMNHWSMPTASMVFRREVLQDYPEWTKKIYSGDLTLMLISMSKGKVFCFSDLTCVYRKVLGANSASNVADANRTYVIDQHQLLYTEFDKWTDGRYHDLIEDVLRKGDLEKRYINLTRRSSIIAFILMPIYTIQKYVRKYNKLKDLITKR